MIDDRNPRGMVAGATMVFAVSMLATGGYAWFRANDAVWLSIWGIVAGLLGIGLALFIANSPRGWGKALPIGGALSAIGIGFALPALWRVFGAIAEGELLQSDPVVFDLVLGLFSVIYASVIVVALARRRRLRMGPDAGGPAPRRDAGYSVAGT